MGTEEKSLMLFNNPKFKPVRVKVVDGEMWFIAKDLCIAADALEIPLAGLHLPKSERRCLLVRSYCPCP